MSRSRNRLVADWFSRLRVNAITNEVEQIDVVDSIAATEALTTTTVNDAVTATTNAVGSVLTAANLKTFGGSSLIGSGDITVNVGSSSSQVFTTSGTWTKPAGINKIHVQLVGAGGGGGGHGESGGAGGYSTKWINVTAITSIGVTVGTGGNGTYYSSSGGNGGTSSLGGYLSATGGGGAAQGQHRGGTGGIGSGGEVNLQGGGGMGHNLSDNGHIGGASYFGGGGPGTHSSNSLSQNYDRQGGPGSGGASGNSGSSYRGAHGANGCVIIWEYT